MSQIIDSATEMLPNKLVDGEKRGHEVWIVPLAVCAMQLLNEGRFVPGNGTAESQHVLQLQKKNVEFNHKSTDCDHHWSLHSTISFTPVVAKPRVQRKPSCRLWDLVQLECSLLLHEIIYYIYDGRFLFLLSCDFEHSFF